MATSLLHQTLFRWGRESRFGASAEPGLLPVASSLEASPAGELHRLHARVSQWLRCGEGGRPESGLCYAVLGGEAVLIRRSQPGPVRSATAHVLSGAAGVLTPRLALELRDWTWASADLPGRAPMVNPNALMAHRSGLTDEARSRALERPLAVLLSHVLEGPRPVDAAVTPATMPLLWAVADICTVLGSGLDDWPYWAPAFETFAAGAPGADPPPGLFLRFRRDGADRPPRPGTLPAAVALARRYVREGTDGLRELRATAGLTELDTMSGRVARLLDTAEEPVAEPMEIPPTPGAAGWGPAQPGPAQPGPAQPGTAQPGSAQPGSAQPGTAQQDAGQPDAGSPRYARSAAAWAEPEQPAAARSAGRGREQVSCPICLGRLDWGELPLYTFDQNLAQYVELTVPRGTNAEQRARLMRTAAVRCPNPGGTTGVHYLPAGYGQYGSPAVYGFIGGTTSGKTHLAAAMVAEIERGALGEYGLTAQPVDLDRHQAFLRDMVHPLFSEASWLAPTREGEVAFADAFVLSGAGRPRAMALFDVAGGELSNVGDAKRFLDIADGLIFVADPKRFTPGSLGDPAFNTVLSLLRSTGRLSKVSAAIVLNKADLYKFDDPVAHWLSRDAPVLDAAEVLEESADVFGYLHQRDAGAWTRPYQECERATLHVVSATGTDAIERGARPLRVLRPLVALMAMTGLLASADAQDVGI
ncbi:hypothetical protein SAMN05443665_10579 [Actinomadura meyerae]|uniref:Uncharacterized protein n=1 Tax=Actinomadura meyerae TaxID=240840 RepID=A0A239P099_9ACTN|nr:hypothetical protein [Actinomadura meyerae]SNT60402.1 hypothetical protein SAMN05443665_10579 [Actinomadura meyerae]